MKQKKLTPLAFVSLQDNQTMQLAKSSDLLQGQGPFSA